VRILIFEAEDLLSGARKEVHCTRLMYFEIDSHKKEHIQFHFSTYEVEKILDFRISMVQEELLLSS
jgi:hypothetical protein